MPILVDVEVLEIMIVFMEVTNDLTKPDVIKSIVLGPPFEVGELGKDKDRGIRAA